MPNLADGLGQERATLQEHHDWSLKLWNRMDRDNSSCITRVEIDCEEFRDVLRAIITPHSAAHGTGGGTYARVTQNTEQAVDFCLRKADFNNDRSLSFEEFKSFTMVLRNNKGAAHTADLIFALFDLDCDGRIDRDEFKEVYRYYLGHHPINEEFVAEWSRLDAGGNDVVTRQDYIRWLQTSANPIFKQHAPPLRGFSDDAVGSLQNIASKSSQSFHSSGMSRTLPGLDDTPNRRTFRSRWNQNFNTKKNGNHEVPSQQRAMFSRSQTIPELSRYFDLHRGFQNNAKRLEKVPELRRHKGVLSTESVPALMPSRDVSSGGTMRNPISGRVQPWNDHWQDPAMMKKKPLPVTLLFQCPGKPPPFLIRLKEEDT